MDIIVLFRLGERLTLTLVVLLVAFIVMVGFWRTVQEIHISEGEKLGVSGTFVLSTPIFVLLTVIGYSWVSLSHPIQLTNNPLATDEQVAEATASSQFVAASPVRQATSSKDLAETQGEIRSLNCLAGASLNERDERALSSVKLTLMSAVWQESWGNVTDFARWARGFDFDEPNSAARDFFEARHATC